MGTFSVHPCTILKCSPKGEGVNPIPQGDLKDFNYGSSNGTKALLSTLFAMAISRQSAWAIDQLSIIWKKLSTPQIVQLLNQDYIDNI